MDSKWKGYDARKVDAGDIAQMFLYAYAYGADAPRPAALLLYPTEAERLAGTPLIVRSVERVKRARIAIRGVPVRILLDQMEARRGGTPALDQLRATVSTALQP